MITRISRVAAFTLAVSLAIPSPSLFADDWPMMGRDRTRNAVIPEKNPPLDWDVKTGRNVKWWSTLGSVCYSSPVVANGLIWIGSNNYIQQDGKWNYADGQSGVLMCFREGDGKLLYKHVSGTLKGYPYSLWGAIGMNCSPLVEGNRLWCTTTRAEVLCLDIGPLRKVSGVAGEIWKLDQVKDLGIYPARGAMVGGPLCSIGASHGDLIYVMTANGIDWAAGGKTVRAPHAPALVCLNKNTGEVVWQDESPGKDTIRGEYGHPLLIEVDGQAQVVAPEGDGWLRSFDALTGELLWKFDINPKNANRSRGEANYFLSAPVWYDGKIYMGSGQVAENGDGAARLCCIDPGKRGDISLELEDGPGKGRPNPNSGEVWHSEEIGRTMSSVAVHHGLVIATSRSGFVYCLDAKTGRQYWRHDTQSLIWASPLIVEDKVYVADEDGAVDILKLSPEKLFYGEFDLAEPIFSSPVFANGVLYVAAGAHLYAIQEGHVTPPPPKAVGWSRWPTPLGRSLLTVTTRP
jgi:outer membrane protein assembly factor BamB